MTRFLVLFLSSIGFICSAQANPTATPLLQPPAAPRAQPQAPKPRPAPAAEAIDAACTAFMSNLMTRSSYSCQVKGSYSGFAIDQKGVPGSFKAQNGSSWKHNGVKGRTKNYKMGLQSYTLDLFKLSLPPEAAQSSSKKIGYIGQCSPSSLKVVSRVKSGGRWTTESTVEIKRTGAKSFSASVKNAEGNLKINCN